MSDLPQTIADAVLELERTLDSEMLDLIRGMQPFETHRFHFGLGMWIRNELGLWGENRALLRECDTPLADDASGVILQALHDHLVETATAEEMKRAGLAWRKFREEEKQLEEEYRAKEIEKDAKITKRRCPACGLPFPTYRKKCKYCDYVET